MKKKVLAVILSTAVLAAVSIGLFRYYYPTHYPYNDRFVLGSSPEEITKRYGEFDRVMKNINGKLSTGEYMICDNTPELVMSYDNSLWYIISFENGIATGIELREGYPVA